MLQEIEATLEAFGEVRTRTWGDVTSVELLQAGRVTFSFQIANRSVELEPSKPAPWTDVLLDSFSDLVRTAAEQVRSLFREEFLDALQSSS